MFSAPKGVCLRDVQLPAHPLLADLYHNIFNKPSFYNTSFTCLLQFKDVLNKELLKILIGIVDTKLLKAKTNRNKKYHEH